MRGLLLTSALAIALPATALAARLEGQLVLEDRPEVARGREIRLFGLTRGGEAVTREARTDEQGHFQFRELEAPAVYLLTTEYDGIRFTAPRTTFHAGEEDEARSVRFEIYRRSPDPTGLSFATARWVLERGEAGTYRVGQSAVIRNPGKRVVVVPDDAPPALTLPLLPAHGEVRTSFGELPEGFAIRDGAVELRGPIYPGDGQIEFSYEVDAGGRDLEAELQIDHAIGEIDVYVRDVGILVDAGPLHAARATRDGDRFYQHYAGTEIEAGSRIPLRIVSLPEPIPAPVWPRFLVTALIAGACAFYVGRPVTRGVDRAERGHEDPEAAEKRALFTSLEDLEHDYETGKLSTRDRDRLREELRADTLRVLSRMRRERPVPESPPEPERRCQCGRPARPDDRFCSGCGRQL